MKTEVDFGHSAKVASELATLSSDPALTIRPDPAFRVKFRNADEIMETDFKEAETGTPLFLTPQPWTDATSLRRSPKE
jgi:hypothetical protein